MPKFFEALGGAWEFHKFQPKTLLESEGVVVVLLDLELMVKATGGRIVEEDEVHIWHFNSAGRVTRDQGRRYLDARVVPSAFGHASSSFARGVR